MPHEELEKEPELRRNSVARLLPWLAGYRIQSLGWDGIAGLTLAAYAIPVSMAYASLAGLPPQCGIYCYLVGGLGYALFGTSRQLAIGPTSAISMSVGVTIGAMVDGDAARWVAIAALTALVVAGLSFFAWLFRLSSLISFISETILLGFKAGAALSIAMTQLPKLFGVPGGGQHFFERLGVLLEQLPQTNGVVLAFGLTAIALLIVGDKWLPGRPIALLVVVLSIVIMSLTGLSQFGVAVVGALPAGLPALQIPSLQLADVDGVFPLALACFLLAYIEGVSAARALARDQGDRIDPRRELLGLGAANVAAAFAQGFPVAGGLSQSMVNKKAGAKSPLALVFASLALTVCLLFLTGLLQNLPSVVLASVVLVAVRGLIDLRGLRRLWQISPSEFWISMVALVGVLLFGILKGVLLAAFISLSMLIAATARPNVSVLGRIPGSRRFSDMARNPENKSIPGLLIFRVEASLLYFNAEYVSEQIVQRIETTDAVRMVCLDLSNSPRVDVAGAEMLSNLQKSLAERGIAFRLVEARAQVRDLLRAVGLEEQIGYFGRHLSLEQIASEFESSPA